MKISGIPPSPKFGLTQVYLPLPTPVAFEATQSALLERLVQAEEDIWAGRAFEKNLPHAPLRLEDYVAELDTVTGVKPMPGDLNIQQNIFFDPTLRNKEGMPALRLVIDEAQLPNQVYLNVIAVLEAFIKEHQIIGAFFGIRHPDYAANNDLTPEEQERDYCYAEPIAAVLSNLPSKQVVEIPTLATVDELLDHINEHGL